MGLFWFAVCLWSCCGVSVSQDFGRVVSHPGDVMIGGLFPIHKNVSKETHGLITNCSDIDVTMLIRAQAMIYAIEKINHSDLLPNVSIGYKMYDTCGDVSMATRGTLKLLEQSHGNMCPLLEEIPGTGAEGVKVVIGERDSETSTAVARLLALPKVAQISYASTSELLSSKTKFPSFLRTVPSDEHQTNAMALFVKDQKWDIVGVIGSDDEYGRYGSETLISLFNRNGVCIAFKEILPAEFVQNETITRTELKKIFMKIETNPTEAIVIFTKTKNVKVILQEAINRRVHRTWLASDSWSTSTEICGLNNIAQIGRVIGFISKRNQIPDFKKYVRQLVSPERNSGGDRSFLLNYLSRYPLCSHGQGDSSSSCVASQSGQKCLQLRCLEDFIDHDDSYSVYLAVNVIAHALNSLLQCHTGCKGSTSFPARELLEEIKRVNITVDRNTHIWFDENGDPSTGQEILQWRWNMEPSTVHISSIGEYDTSGTIKLNTNLTVDKFFKETNCSKSCEPGYELKRLKNSCCKTCHQCRNKSFSKGDGEECQPCSSSLQYASPDGARCLNKTVSFLKWWSGWSVALLLCDGLGALLTLLVALLFFLQRSTPIVKAAGGYLCFLALLSLLVCFASVAVGLSEPTDLTCKVEMPLFLLAFTLCVACILANLLQVCVGFSFSVTMTGALKRLNRPALVTFVCFGGQAVLCSLWVIFWPPNRITKDDLETRIIVACCKGSMLLCVAVFMYVCLLAVVCFAFAYNGRQLPDLYKNARYVAVSMLVYLVVCLLFLPFYLSYVTRYGQGIKACALLLITYSVLICHFAPKCYIMLFRKELNDESALAEYIRNHFNQKSIRVLSS
ncbi:G-protein coupled receptor family C group 6 member A-like [Sardina pilchardus]|uniref:G-protein coupled receptor family C group 6 member A-like n=1 Tax=Sardina pilchardus TaxID=27697 RepID=UPI002E0E446E